MKTENVINERTHGDYEAMKNPMNRNEIVISIKNGGSMIAKVQAYEVEDHEFEKNALFIVKACNAHDSLLSALKGLTKEITQPGYPLHSGMTIIWLDKARAAIKQAEEL